MKKIFSIALLFLSIFTGSSQDFSVENYTIIIEISEKGYFDVIENYDLNFEAQKHGIFRTIQTEYDLLNSEGQQEKRKIKIDNIDVPNHKFEAPFDFQQKLEDNLIIKIGDKDKTVFGKQHYEITYRVFDAFLFEKDFIRFYWNLKPDGWSADFNQISFTIRAPKNIELSQENSFVYTGIRGDSLLSKDMQLNFEGNQLIGKSNSNFVSRPGESVTVLINLPVGSVKELKPIWPFWTNNGWVFLVGILVSGFYYVFRKFGKDDKVISTTSYYAPENIDPAMAGFLIDDREDNSDLIALIPYWGNKGLIRIEEIPKKGLFGKGDTKIIRIKELPNNATQYERDIFIGLFGSDFDGAEKEVLISSLKDSFYTTMNSAKSSLKENAQTYYEAKSKKVQTITLVVLLVSAILFGIIGLFFWGIIALIVIVITSVVLLVFNILMVKKNAKGNQILSELKGFKQFIKVAEENKLKMLLKDDPGYFENTMGYALAFGLFEKWAKKFEALHIPPPNWYTSSTGHYLGMRDFSKSFSGAMSSTQSTMVSSPSKSSGSSGGGSSGGGFGGGGGGSW